MHAPKSIQDPVVQSTIRLTAEERDFFPSPGGWEDQVLYFLLPDRFSDNNELDYRDNNNKRVIAGSTPLFTEADRENALLTEKSRRKFLDASAEWIGGNIKGITSKMGYLKRMGVTALWIAPVLKQVTGQPTFHGYCIQNFLQVDPRWGSNEDLQYMVKEAHRAGIRVILDVLINHCGDVFAYEESAPAYNDEQHKTKGFWNETRTSKDFIPLGRINERDYPNAYPEAGIWPAELQDPDCFSRKGEIVNWEEDPEYLEGDFWNLKKLNLGDTSDDCAYFKPTPALLALVDIWKFWLAYCDLDGFRIDAAKHLGVGPLRYFVDAIREFAESLGKHNFLLVAEIAGPKALELTRSTGLSGALGVGEPQEGLWCAPQGLIDPICYFKHFSNSRGEGGFYRNEIVTMIDDHDMIWKNGLKARFGASIHGVEQLPAALGMNLCTAGIPCIYYGTEQSFNGTSEPPPFLADAFVREAMFGGTFGAFRSNGRHFFDETAPGYRLLHDITKMRSREPALRRGAQYLRPISLDGQHFALPQLEKPAFYNSMEEPVDLDLGPPLSSIVAWSRILGGTEIVCAINTDPTKELEAWVLVDAGIQKDGDIKDCLYPPRKPSVTAKWMDGFMAVYIRLAPGGFVVYK